MARLTFQNIIADVQRKPGLERLSLGEVTDAIALAAKDIGNQAWPWNYTETNVLVPANYTTGTISITDGTAIVTGNLTAWDPTWYGRRIRFGNSNLDYIVSSIPNPTTIILAQNVNLGANLTNTTYNLYQDTYAYPADYMIGSDVALLQPTVRTRIPKIPRYKFEMIMNAGLRSFSTNIQMFYCDHGLDTTTGQNFSGRYRFRLGPPPSGPAELRLCYHRMAADLSYFAYTELPDGFDDVVGLMAASRLYDLHRQPGESAQVKALAIGKLKLLRRQTSTQTVDNVPDAMYEVPDSSISQWGMTIARL